MLFHSYEYLFFFLPLVLMGYYVLLHVKAKFWARCFLVAASLFFCGWMNTEFLGLFVLSMLVNYVISRLLWVQKKASYKKLWVTVGVVGNVALLGFFKYSNFFLDSFNVLLGTSWPLLHIAFPLAISFYSFQQISFLVEIHRGKVGNYTFLDYALFTSFFPKLISGPIIKHDEIMGQLRDPEKQKFDSHDCAAGIYQFVIGLGKKVLIADTLAHWVSLGFDSPAPGELLMTEAWIAAMANMLQIYYDFSGYTDMALGTARMFRIELPTNFNSPYRATNIQDFWRRWHITLSRFLRENVYFPLGGSRKGAVRTSWNVFVTFVICGLWHGAGWTYVIWGGMHGLGLAVHRIFNKLGGKLPVVLGWALTMLFSCITRVFFRSPDVETAVQILKAMVNLDTLILPADWLTLPALLSTEITFGLFIVVFILIFGLVHMILPNSDQMAKEFVPRTENIVFVAVIAAVCIVQLYGVNEFIYFNF